jgi:hypothetical protein
MQLQHRQSALKMANTPQKAIEPPAANSSQHRPESAAFRCLDYAGDTDAWEVSNQLDKRGSMTNISA